MKNQYLLVTISDEVEKNCDPSVNASPKTFFSHDRRAPGCEMKSLQKQMDYDQKRLMATRAIQNKPAGEPRTPTPSWSGLGFSNSMPENVIREKVAAQNIIFLLKFTFLKIPIFIKYTFRKNHFSKNSHYEILNFHKIQILKISIFTKFT